MNRSHPLMFLCIVSQVQSLFVTVVASFPRTLMGSLEKVFKSISFVVLVHWSVGVVVSMSLQDLW